MIFSSKHLNVTKVSCLCTTPFPKQTGSIEIQNPSLNTGTLACEITKNML